jgi:hypothetical protein
MKPTEPLSVAIIVSPQTVRVDDWILLATEFSSAHETMLLKKNSSKHIFGQTNVILYDKVICYILA